MQSKRGWNAHPYARIYYQGRTTDSTRWDQFIPHPEDVFICAPAKHGTTWMQTLVTFLLYQTTALDFVPADDSPWFDSPLVPLDWAVAQIQRPGVRNLLKTHTPLDGIPYFPEASYIFVYRDPRDAFISKYHHQRNLNLDSADSGAFACLETAFEDWIQQPFVPGQPAIKSSLGSMVHHLACVWPLRAEPHIHLFHYADLLENLTGAVQRLAQILRLELTPALCAQIINAASFRQMHQDYQKYVPMQSYWHQPQAFLRSGQRGQWRTLISADLLQRFETYLAAIAPPDMARWLCQGGGHFRPLTPVNLGGGF